MMLPLASVGALGVLMVVVIWKLTAIQQSSRQLRRSVEELQLALRDEAMVDETLFVSLREAKHFSAAHQQDTQIAVDEIRERLGLEPFDWTDRQEHRRLWLEHLHRGQLGPTD